MPNKKKHYEDQYPNIIRNGKKVPTGPNANKSISGTWRLEHLLSTESLAALYRAKLRAEGK